MAPGLNTRQRREVVCDAERGEGGDVALTAANQLARPKAALLSLHRRELRVFMSQANGRLTAEATDCLPTCMLMRVAGVRA